MLCCIGDLVEDIVVWLSDDIAVGTDTAASIHRRQGGSAANVAVSAALGGAAVRFIGRVGSDAIGRALIEQIRFVGVDGRVQTKGRTGTIVVLVDDSGERTMLPDRAAATELTDVPPSDLDGVTWLHVPAYSLTIEPLATASRSAIRAVKHSGGSISIDASSVAIIEEHDTDEFASMISALQPDVMFCNADEAAVLGIEDTKGLPGVEVVVIKAGGEPARAYRNGALDTSVPALDVTTVRDTTGAGDAFAAGFIVEQMDSGDLRGAMVQGHRFAAQVLTDRSS